MGATGSRTNSMATVLKVGPTALVTKALMFREEKMAKDISFGRIRVNLLASFATTILRGKVFTLGIMGAAVPAPGRITKCTVKASLNGLMAASMKVPTLMIRKMGMGDFIG